MSPFETFALGSLSWKPFGKCQENHCNGCYGFGQCHDVVLNISKFATMIFVDLFNHKGKEENNGNTRMEHLDRVVAWALKEFKVGIVDLHVVEKDGVQNLFL